MSIILKVLKANSSHIVGGVGGGGQALEVWCGLILLMYFKK